MIVAKDKFYRIFGIVSLFSAFCFTVACQETRHPDRFLIPEGYVGWVTVIYNVKGAPVLRQEGNYRLYEIPPDGRLVTSSFIEWGSALDQFYYYNVRNERHQIEQERLIQAPYHTPDDDSTGKLINVQLGFFVGTVEQYANREERSKDENGKIIIKQ